MPSLHHPLRDLLYGDPARAVPMLNLALAAGVGLLTRSPGLALATAVAGDRIWDRLSPRMVIEDPRLGPLTLNCPRRTPDGRKQVWLTFDDGPGPDTGAVLDILEQHQARATFFLIGHQVESCAGLPALRRRLQAAGHLVGNHSWSHPSFLALDSRRTLEELQRTQSCLREAFPDSVTRLFRPPYGYRTEALFTHARAQGLQIMGWSLNSLDFLSGPAGALVQRVLSRAAPGSILLFHDGPQGRRRTLAALPEILAALTRQGYAFGTPTLEDLL
jgi:peptidoglycan/xylan/chitin deacetylase (PgdA/CDA1 family)